MSDVKPGIKKFVETTAEPVLKLGAAALGALYVFGLLVSNLHLMSVGVSEFTSLRAQNVMTGSLIMFYIGCLLALALPWSMAACVCGISLCSEEQVRSKVRTCSQAVFYAVVFWFAAAALIGSAWGFLYPWGPPWVPGRLGQDFWSLKSSFSEFERFAQQYMDTFGTRKVVTGYLFFSLVLAYWLIKLDATRFFGASRNNLGPDAAHFVNVGLLLVRITLPLFALVAILGAVVGFAQDVYPNIKANLGGGQPDVAELQLEPGDTGKIMLPPDLVSAAPNEPGVATRVGPVVIWYQSDKFLYISPFVENDRGSERLIAIDIKMVRLIRYIPASVRISGRRIVKIHMQ
jgi:hypothetical protein